MKYRKLSNGNDDGYHALHTTQPRQSGVHFEIHSDWLRATRSIDNHLRHGGARSCISLCYEAVGYVVRFAPEN